MKDPREEMKNRAAELRAKGSPIQESFDELQLSPEAVEKFDGYCADEISDEEYFKLLPSIDFFQKYGLNPVRTYNSFARTSGAIQWLMQRRGDSLPLKFMNLLFAIGGETIAALFQTGGYQLYQLSNFCETIGMTPAQRTAMWAAGYQDSFVGGGRIYQRLDAWKKPAEQIYHAMTLCKGYRGTYKALLAALFLLRVHTCKKEPVEDKENKIAEAVRILEQSFEHEFSEEIFKGSLSHEIDKCIQYAKNRKGFEASGGLLAKMKEAVGSLFRQEGAQLPLAAEIKRLRGERYDHTAYRIACVMACSGMFYSGELAAAFEILGRIHRDDMFRAFTALYGVVPYEEYVRMDPEKFLLPGYLNYLVDMENGYCGVQVKLFFQKASVDSPKDYSEVIRTSKLDTAAVLLENLTPEQRRSGKFPMRENDLLVKLWQDMVSGKNQTYEQQIMDYAEGRIGTDQILPILDQMDSFTFRQSRGPRAINMTYSLMGMTEELKRTLVLMTSQQNYMLGSTFFETAGEHITDRSKEYLKAVYGEIPMKRFFGIFSAGIQTCYWYSYNDGLKKAFLNLLYGYVKDASEKNMREFLDCIGSCLAEARAQMLSSLVKADQWNIQYVIDFMGDSSKTVKEAVVKLLGEKWAQTSCEPKVLEKLKSKKAAEREMAIRILGKWGADQYKDALNVQLAAEKSAKLQSLIRATLDPSASTEVDTGTGGTIEDYIANIVKGNKKASLAWIYQTPCCPVHKKDGSDAPEEWMNALMLSYSTMAKLGINQQAAQIAAMLNTAELEQFAEEVFDKWMAAGAESKKKWVLYFASIHGGIRIVNRLKQQIQEWPKAARGAIAAEAVWALSLNPTDSALLIVDSISRKFKFRQVKNAAADALVYAAKELGITTEQLSDKIVPDLGFDADCSQIFDYGERKFKVYLNPALELEVYDESDKKLKNLPAPGKRDDEEKANAAYAQFKLVKKEMKTVVTTQKLRLELALATDRRWTVPEWKALFVSKPVMHQFAIGLVWGMYDGNELKETFRYMEDGTFNTREQDEYDLEEAGENNNIGLIHPVELTEDELAEWKEQLDDYEITQPFNQLDRPIYEVTEEEKNALEMTRMSGRKINGLSLSGKLLKSGWYRGSVLDGGGYYDFYTESESLKIGADLEFEGLYVGDENEETTIKGVKFYRAGTVERGSYVYDEIKDANQYKLGDVPKKYFSEILYQVDLATKPKAD